METPHISRSGRVLKKTAKVIEMEDFDLNELDLQGKPKKKGRASEDEFDEKRVAPIKIPKISLSLPSASRRPGPIMKLPMKPKPEERFMMDSSPEGSKESDSSTSETTSSSSTSSDDSEDEVQQRYPLDGAKGGQTIQQSVQGKVIVESYRQFESLGTFADNSSQMRMEVSDDDNSESALVIAEESSDFLKHRSQKSAAVKKRPVIKSPIAQLKKMGVFKKRPIARPISRPLARNVPAAKKEKPAGKTKPLTAYLLWCRENRKRIAASGAIGFGDIGKKLGETWQALPEKEKMAWKGKAKRLALKSNGGLISTGSTNENVAKTVSCSTSNATEDVTRNLPEGGRPLGTAAIDSAAHLKLLGDSLSVIGQRLTEHEGQLAVSGIFSVLLDTVLCVVGPLLCLTSESPYLNAIPEETSRRTLDSIAYFMPGL